MLFGLELLLIFRFVPGWCAIQTLNGDSKGGIAEHPYGNQTSTKRPVLVLGA